MTYGLSWKTGSISLETPTVETHQPMKQVQKVNTHELLTCKDIHDV